MEFKRGTAKHAARGTILALLLSSACAQSRTPVHGHSSVIAPASNQVAVQPISRIIQLVDDTLTERVPHSTHPLAIAANDQGRVDANLSMKRMLLVLKISEQQQAALTQLIGNLHDPDSAHYQKWLTPEQYAVKFGPTPDDLHQITSWLTQHGFEVANVARGGQWIEFSGTAAQVESAFHTEMHNYVVNGEKRVANSTDISLPRALTPVVSGVLSLHNFPAKPFHSKLFQVRRDPVTGKLSPAASSEKAGVPKTVAPEFTSGHGNHYLAPADWSKIYGSAPLLAKGINGSGISIAIVGSDTDIQLSDIRTFRQIFKLPAKDPEIIVNGIDPGVSPFSSFEIEAALDIEWSNAIAPDATIKFVTSASTASTAGFDLSIAHIVDNRIAPIMSTSIGECEMFLGTAGNAFLNGAYQQAAAEGISVIAAAGDTGAAGCDPQLSFSPAFFGVGVNGAASTPYDVAIGGTMFAENGLDSNYWRPKNQPDLSSVFGYIPETVWNESCDPTIDPNQCQGSFLYFLEAGSGGASNCTVSTVVPGPIFTCYGGYAKPSWQAGTGVPDDGTRDLPDISFTAGGHDGYLVCVEGSCQSTTSDGQTVLQQASVVGGTSAGAPSFAGAVALLEQQKRPYLGLLNFNLYKIAAAADLSLCNSSNLTDPNQPNDCAFYDTTSGNNDVPGQPGNSASLGFDLASGLGSVNVEKLAARWDSVPKLRSITKLSVNEDNRNIVQHGQPLPMSVLVKPTKGGGAPSGDFSLLTSTFRSVFGGTLTNGSFSGGISNLPGGDYQLRARYSGDAMFSASESRSLSVKIAPEDSVIAVQAWDINFVDAPAPVEGSVLYGEPVGLQIDIRGKSGVGSCSGTITIRMDAARTLGPFPLNAAGNAFVWLFNIDPTLLPVGDHKFVVSYSGDSSFKPSSTSPVSFTVRKAGDIQDGVFPVQDTGVTSMNVGVPIDFVAFVSQSDWNTGSHPTGSVQLFECPSPEPSCAPRVAIRAPAVLSQDGPLGMAQPFGQATWKGLLFPAGDHSIRIGYSGDANFTPLPVEDGIFSRGWTFTVAPAINATITFRQSVPTSITLGQSQSYQVSLRPSHRGDPMPTGTITLYDITGSPAQNVSPASLANGNASFVVPWYFAGEGLLFAGYSGDSNYGSLSSASLVTLVKPAQPTVNLTPAATAVSPNVQTSFTVLVGGGPSNPSIQTPAGEQGQVEYFDSLNGAAPQVLGNGPQFLTVGNANTSINVLAVGLARGVHVITARFLGTPDWAATTSNAIVIRVGGNDHHQGSDGGS